MKKISLILIAAVCICLAGCNDNPEVDDINTQNLSVFPSPASSVVHINAVATNNEPSVLKAFDSKGKVILNESISSGQAAFQLSLTGKPSGTYHVVFETGGDVITKKFIKL